MEAFEPRVDPRPDDREWPQLQWPVPAGTVLRGRVVELARADPERDAVPLFEALDDDRVWRHMRPRPGSPQELARWIAAQRDEPGLHRWTVRALRDLPSAAGERIPAGAVLGQSSYLEVVAGDARLEIGSTAYAPAVWAGAVNPEAKLLLLRFAFERLSAGRVQLKTDIRNERSQRAIARLGARYEGVLRRYQRRADGTVRDTVLFSITAEEWPEVEAGLLARLEALATG